jgi:hypothetical protein
MLVSIVDLDVPIKPIREVAQSSSAMVESRRKIKSLQKDFSASGDF